jgi:two-component system sensor histidine kinase EvgS
MCSFSGITSVWPLIRRPSVQCNEHLANAQKCVVKLNSLYILHLSYNNGHAIESLLIRNCSSRLFIQLSPYAMTLAPPFPRFTITTQHRAPDSAALRLYQATAAREQQNTAPEYGKQSSMPPSIQHALVLVLVLAATIVALAICARKAIRSAHSKRLSADACISDQAFHDLVLNTASFPRAIFDSHGRVTAVNPHFEHLMRQPEGAMVGKTVREIGTFGRESGQYFESLLNTHTRSGRPQHGEFGYVEQACRPRAMLYWISTLTRHSLNETVLATLVDITGIRNAEKRARYREQFLQRATVNLPGIVYKLRRDRSGVLSFRYVAGHTVPLFGLSPGEMMADERRAFATVHPADQAHLAETIASAAAARTGFSNEFRVRSPDGERWIQSRASPGISTSPDVMAWDGYWIDATDARRQAEGLRLARLTAEQALAAQSRFLATMSHEIRTPMSGVISTIELLSASTLNPSQRTMVDTIGNASHALLRILNSVLDFARIDAGQLSLEASPFDLREITEDACRTLSTGIQAKGLQLGLHIDEKVAATLLGDSLRVRQILSNVIDNAAKFTDKGNIEVSIRVASDAPDRQTLDLCVQDSGIGIDCAHIAGVLEPFAQAEASTTRRFGGSGLGLPICKHLAERMGGTLALSSEFGVGTTVCVRVQMPVVQRTRTPHQGCVGRSVRLELPHSVATEQLACELRSLGFNVADAVEPTPVELLFIEEAAPPPKPDCPVIRVSTRAVHGGFLCATTPPTLGIAPLFPSAVLSVCLNALGLANGAAPQSATNGDAGGLMRTHPPILVADDHELCQVVWRRQLDALGYPYQIVSNGEEALRALHSARYSMLITDLWMPRLDGYTLARLWRTHELQQSCGNQAGRLPIIAVSADVMNEDQQKERCLAAGIDDKLSKPIALSSLQALLSKHIDATLATGAITPETTGPQASAPTTLQALCATYGGSATVRRMLYAARDAARVQITTLKKERNKRSVYAACLHDIIAAAHLFNDTPLIDACTAAQRALADRVSLSGQWSLYEDICQMLAAYIRRLEGMLDLLSTDRYPDTTREHDGARASSLERTLPGCNR